jgi:hypothetical protein
LTKKYAAFHRFHPNMPAHELFGAGSSLLPLEEN